MSISFRRKLSELALLYALPEIYQGSKNSRIYGLQKRLQKAVIPALHRISGSSAVISKAVQDIFKWGTEIGWLNNQEPIGTLISFCIEMVEESPIEYSPEILEILQLLSKHLDDGNLLRPTICFDGRKAAEAWQDLFQIMEVIA